MSESLLQAASAATGGMAATVLLFPLETIKTRLQAERSRCAASHPPGTLETGSRIVAEGGVIALFSGVLPATIQAALEKSIYFYAYTLLKEAHEAALGPVKTLGNLAVGYLADWVHLPVTLPIDRVVKSMQTSGGNAGVLTVAKAINRDQGIAGFYKGLVAYFILCGRPAIQFTVFEQLRAVVLAARAGGKKRPKALSALEAFVLGALARCLATLVVYPFIRAKVMAQAARSSPPAAAEPGDDKVPPSSPPTMMESMAAVYREEGVAGLYRGVHPELLRGTLSSGVLLMIKERVYVFNRRLLLRDNSPLSKKSG
jgi:adenine nucleotide transporter 17